MNSSVKMSAATGVFNSCMLKALIEVELRAP